MKKRILILNYEFPPLGGGAANATYYLLKEFSKDKNLDIDLVTSSTDKFRVEEFSSNITVHYLNIGKKGNLHYQSKKDLLKYSYKSYDYSKKLLSKGKYDLIHAFFGIPSGYIAMKLSKKYSLPYIVSLRGSDVPFYNKRFEYLDRYLFRFLSKKIWLNAKSVIANSKGLKDLALKTSPNQQIKVIYNGVDTNFFKPAKNIVSKKFTLVSTGRLISRKGYDYLIQSVEGLNLKIVLVGDGPEREYLKKLSKEKKVAVEFKGVLSKELVLKELQKANTFVLPSLNEGMSNSALEAISCSLPVILTDVGGSSELINKNGFIIKPKDKHSLRKSVIKLMENKTLQKTFSSNSRILAKKMSWEKMSEEYKQAYNS